MNEHNIKAESEVVVEQEVVKNLNQLSVDFNHGRKELVADLLNQLQSNTHLSLLLQQNGLDRDTFLSKVQAIFDPEKISIFEYSVRGEIAQYGCGEIRDILTFPSIRSWGDAISSGSVYEDFEKDGVRLTADPSEVGRVLASRILSPEGGIDYGANQVINLRGSSIDPNSKCVILYENSRRFHSKLVLALTAIFDQLNNGLMGIKENRRISTRSSMAIDAIAGEMIEKFEKALVQSPQIPQKPVLVFTIPELILPAQSDIKTFTKKSMGVVSPNTIQVTVMPIE